jgi:hypothetical protein
MNLRGLSPHTAKSILDLARDYKAPTSREYLAFVGTEGLRYQVKAAILAGLPAAAARYTRSLVRHMKATGQITEADK